MRRWLVVLLAAALAVAGCGDDSDSGDPGDSTETATSTTLAPKTGGVLSVAMPLEPAGLDPVVALGGGLAGGNQMAAIYDVLMRWDAETRKFVGVTAESATPNATYTEWTVKIRPGIAFSDGTNYDAAAVKYGLDRHRSGQAGAPPCAELRACPRTTVASSSFFSTVKAIDVVDPLTLKVTLSEAWADFPFVLSSVAGMIPSPTALQKCDPAKPPAQCAFNLNPVGAGPFTIEAFKSKEAITMVRNTSYWNGPVYLDGLKFVILDGGGARSLDGVKASSVDAAYLRDAGTIAQAVTEKVAGSRTILHSGSSLLMNNGLNVTCTGGQPAKFCAGKPDATVVPTNPPTAIPEVRQAIAMAIDVAELDRRANDGKGLPGSSMFQSGFSADPGVPGTAHDPEAAKKLVTQAKAAGWNGKVRFLGPNTPFGQALGVTLQAMLGSVGIELEVDTTKDGAAVGAQYIVNRDFDITWVSLTFSDDGGLAANMSQSFASTSTANRSGWKNSTVDQAIKDLRSADTVDKKRAALKTIAEQYKKDAPMVTLGAGSDFFIWRPAVQGVQPSQQTIMLLSKAWIS